MRKYRKVKLRKIRKHKQYSRKPSTKGLRSGSKAIKNKLLEVNPHCDICGSRKNLQLHHVYLIRHCFKSKLERCVLLCPVCHHDFHSRWDKYLDAQFKKDPDSDFMAIYNTLKKL